MPSASGSLSSRSTAVLPQRPHHAAAEERLPAFPAALRLHPDLHDGGGYSHHRQRGGAPRAHPRKSGRRGPSKITPPLPASSSSCRLRCCTAIASRRCVSCWRAVLQAVSRVSLPPLTAAAIATHIANIFRGFWRNNDNFRPCIGPFPTMCRHKRPAPESESLPAQGRSQPIKIEVRRLRSSQDYTIYTSAQKTPRRTFQPIRNATPREKLYAAISSPTQSTPVSSAPP
jgi:hypothetical protein